MQIFNLKQNVAGDDLDHLELFTKFGELVAGMREKEDSSSDTTPFQNLVFLVRDWSSPRDHPYGLEGG